MIQLEHLSRSGTIYIYTVVIRHKDMNLNYEIYMRGYVVEKITPLLNIPNLPEAEINAYITNLFV